MYDLSDALLWSVSFVPRIFLVAALGYLYYRDRDKRKLMFMPAFAMESVGYLHPMLNGWGGIIYIADSYRWTALPVIAAISITAFSSLVKVGDFGKPFKAFLAILAGSILMLTIPGQAIESVPFMPFFSALSLASVAVLVYLVAKRRDVSDLMFLLALVCFIFANAGINGGLAAEFIAFTSFFGVTFTLLMFVIPAFTISASSAHEGTASFFVPKGRLERTQEDLKTTQEKLLKAERLATIGELAGMVGHDLRNPLTGINTAVFYLERNLNSEKHPKIKEMLNIIGKNVGHANEIINDLLEYSREIRLELETCEPRLLVEEALLLVKIPDNVRLTNSTEDKPSIRIDNGKLKRCFVNLIKNAADAMPNGGELKISSRDLGDEWEIAFEDTGVGMSKETLQKLWTPLFTTKSKGMGFGLPICKRFIEAHGGSVSVESTVGKGTAFRLTFPVDPAAKGDEMQVELSESASLITKA